MNKSTATKTQKGIKGNVLLIFGLISTIILLMAASCGGPPPAQAPKIISVSPSNASNGIKNDVNIIITFNNPMDTASVEAAYQSNTDRIKPNQVKFSWNSDKTILTINPNKSLQYVPAKVDNHGNPPYKYSYSIAKTATDTNANNLDKDYDFSFSTLRIRKKFALYSSIDADVRSDGLVGGCSSSNQKNDSMCVGESGLKGHPFYRSFIGFDLSNLPNGIEIYAADLYFTQYRITGEPYKKHGFIIVDHVDFGKEIDKNDFNTKADYIGKFSGSKKTI